MQIVTSPPKKMFKFLIFVCFWSASAAAELRLGFQQGAVSSIDLSPCVQSSLIFTELNLFVLV